MLTALRRNARVVVSVGILTALVGGPVIAGNMAPNSDKVDGFHAVGAGARPPKRGGKLVATNSQGRLPNNIIKKAPDANKLDGLDSKAFLQTGDEIQGANVTGTVPDADTLDGKDSDFFAYYSEMQDKADRRRHVKVVDIARTDGSPDATQSGSSLRSAVTSIGDAPGDDPWVVLLAPGVYDLGTDSLSLGANVSLVGAGRNETTVTASGSAATVYMGTDSTVSDLRIEHDAAFAYSTGIRHNGNFDSQLIRVDVLAENGTLYTEAVSIDTGEMLLKDVDATAFAGTGAGVGINAQSGADIDVYDSKILGRFDTHAYGIWAGPGSYTRVIRSDIEGRSAPSSWGVYGQKSSGEILDSVVHTTAASTFTAALEVSQPDSGTRQYTVRGSVLEAWRNIDDATQSWTAIARASTTINIANSQLSGGNPFAAGTMKCAGVYDENFNFSASTCFP